VVEDEVYDSFSGGPQRLAVGRLKIRAHLTWEQARVTFAVLAFGDINVIAGLRDLVSEEEYRKSCEEITEAFEKGDIPAEIRAVDHHFPQPNNYSLWHLFRDQQRQVVAEILKPKYRRIGDLYRSIYEGNYAIMDFLRSLHNPVPKPLYCAADATLDLGFSHVFGPDFSVDRLRQLIDDAIKWSISIDKDGLGLAAVSWLDRQVRQMLEAPEDPSAIPIMETARDVLEILCTISLELHPWRAQNMYFRIRKHLLPSMEERATGGEEAAARWVRAFRELAVLLYIKV
jgi:hypothetical protein